MKKVPIVVTASALVVGLAAGATAQTSSSPSRPAADRPATEKARGDAAQRPAWVPQGTAVETSKIIGMRVRTPDGKNAAEIDQLIVNPGDGKITHAVLGKGGMLGLGETKIVVDWSDIKLQRDTEKPDRWVAVVDQGKLDSAPRFEARRARDTAPAASPSATSPSSRPSEPAKKQ